MWIRGGVMPAIKMRSISTTGFQPAGLDANSFRPDGDPSLVLNRLARRFSDSIQKGDTAYCLEDMNRPPILPLYSTM
jgi:hypothetical protein